MSTMVMFALGIPLTLSMRELIIKKNVASAVSGLVINSASPLASTNINSINVVPRKEYLQVDIQVAAPLDSITQADIDRLREYLTEEIDRSIRLQVEIIPMRMIESPQE